jgi:ParB-like chromosome segregation protein Spo0J
VWVAEQRGQALPPISVARVGDAYAVRDGHHRVSVARARGALTIDATLDGV